eukprot:gene5637-21179_t
MHCGNIGCVGLKKFATMSPVVTCGYALERFGRKIGAQGM